MPPILKRNPRRTITGAIVGLFSLAALIQEGQAIHAFVSEHSSWVVIGLAAIVYLTYAKTVDHTRNDEHVQRELDGVKSAVDAQGRGIRFLMRKLGGKEGEEHVKLLFGDKE